MDPRANLDRHLRGSRRVDLTGVAWDRIPDHPLAPAEVRCLAYMMDIESHTMVFVRDLLATRVAEEPELTAFLACWAYEELWHGEAFSRFLGEAGVTLPPDWRPTRWDDPYPSRAARNRWVRRSRRRRARLTRLGMVIGSAVSPDFPAVHMTWGAINELSTLSGYQRLAERSANPVLGDLLRRIVRDERRHYAFYRLEAERRLGASAGARRVTRFALEHLWAIVGTGIRPQAETDFVFDHLFGDEEGLRTTREADAMIHSLPGLDGLRLFERARAQAKQRLGRAGGDRRQPPAERAFSLVRSPSRGSGGTVSHR
jgi:rubrerythrin